MATTPDLPDTATSRRPKGDGSIHHEPERNRYVGRIRIDGRVRKVTGKNPTQVAQRMRDLVAIDAAGGGIDKTATVADVLTDWRKRAAPNRTTQTATLDTYDWAIAHWIKAIGRKRVAELRPTHVEAVMRRWAADGLSHSSLTKLRSVLNLAMKRALVHRVIPINPVAGAELPTGAKRTPVLPIFDEAQAAEFQAAVADHEWAGLFLLMVTGGLRPGEAVAVCADAVDLDAGLIEVRRARKLSKGKGALGDTLKTDKSHRVIDVPPWTIDALRRRIEATGATGADLLYPDERGGVLTPGTVGDVMAEVCIEAGLPVIPPKQLRPTHATILVNAGVPLVKVQDRLGHVDLRMLLATYRHRPEVATGAAAMTAPATQRPRRLRAVG